MANSPVRDAARLSSPAKGACEVLLLCPSLFRDSPIIFKMVTYMANSTVVSIDVEHNLSQKRNMFDFLCRPLSRGAVTRVRAGSCGLVAGVDGPAATQGDRPHQGPGPRLPLRGSGRVIGIEAGCNLKGWKQSMRSSRRELWEDNGP